MSDTPYPAGRPVGRTCAGLAGVCRSRRDISRGARRGAGTLLVLAAVAGVCPARPAVARPDLPATCETIAHVVATLPEDDWASTVVAMKRQRIVGLSVSDPITATILCPHAPQVVCMEISNPEKAFGDVVSLTGRIARADGRYVLLDPCFSMKS